MLTFGFSLLGVICKGASVICAFFGNAGDSDGGTVNWGDVHKKLG